MRHKKNGKNYEIPHSKITDYTSMRRNRINWFDTRYGIQRAEVLSQHTFKPKVNIIHLDRVIKEGSQALTCRPNYKKMEEDRKRNKNKIFGNEVPRDPMIDVYEQPQ